MARRTVLLDVYEDRNKARHEKFHRASVLGELVELDTGDIEYLSEGSRLLELPIVACSVARSCSYYIDCVPSNLLKIIKEALKPGMWAGIALASTYISQRQLFTKERN